MRRVRKVLCSAALVLAGMACGGGNSVPAPDDGIRIVATVFPEYDWTREILGENPADAELVLLLDSGVDLHSYQPSAEDILKISSCDLFIYVGGESDEWVDEVLRSAVNPDMTVISLLEVLGDAVKEEEMTEGMQEEEEEESEEEEPEADEHVWLSLRNAAVVCDAIAGALSEIDPDHADIYARNAASYREKLDELDAQYVSVTAGAERNTLLFGDRFPFRYLTDDYGLEYYAAFAGCSAETEASFETIAFLSGKADELALPAVIALEGTDHRIAETIVANTENKDQRILVMNSMQGTTMKDVRNGVTYLQIMADNLTVLKEALGQE